MSRRNKRDLQELEQYEFYFKYILPRHFTLNNDRKMPSIGLGTFDVRSYEVVMKTIDDALNAGYRMFDTAALYGNEIYLNVAFKQLLPKYHLQREDIFITTKLSPCHYGGGAVTERAFHTSLFNLGLDYIDLYLVHYPGNAYVRAEEMNSRVRNSTWFTLTQLYYDGKINSLGVSNYTTRHLVQLMECNYGVVPAVNQVEWHPYYNHVGLYDYCKQFNIVLQAYSPLGGHSSFVLLNDPTVVRVAKKLNVTPAQVLLVWSIQQDVSVIPKSVNADRLKENITLRFTIPSDDLEDLNDLHVKNKKFSWDPAFEY